MQEEASTSRQKSNFPEALKSVKDFTTKMWLFTCYKDIGYFVAYAIENETEKIFFLESPYNRNEVINFKTVEDIIIFIYRLLEDGLRFNLVNKSFLVQVTYNMENVKKMKPFDIDMLGHGHMLTNYGIVYVYSDDEEDDEEEVKRAKKRKRDSDSLMQEFEPYMKLSRPGPSWK